MAGQAFCKQCGTTLESGARFCSECGNAVDSGPKVADTPVLQHGLPAPSSWKYLRVAIASIAFVAFCTAVAWQFIARDGSGFAEALPLGSPGIPSAVHARRVFENKHADEIKRGLITIDAFTKTNGQKKNVLGVEAYVIEFAATVTYPKGFMPECIGSNKVGRYNETCFRAQMMAGPNEAFDLFKEPGHKKEIKGTLAFERTERGWRGEDGQLY